MKYSVFSYTFAILPALEFNLHLFACARAQSQHVLSLSLMLSLNILHFDLFTLLFLRPPPPPPGAHGVILIAFMACAILVLVSKIVPVLFAMYNCS